MTSQGKIILSLTTLAVLFQLPAVFLYMPVLSAVFTCITLTGLLATIYFAQRTIFYMQETINLHQS